MVDILRLTLFQLHFYENSCVLIWTFTKVWSSWQEVGQEVRLWCYLVLLSVDKKKGTLGSRIAGTTINFDIFFP